MANVLVAYFSASGVTAKAAKALADAAQAELYEIKPAVPYTQADLNWMDKKSRSSVEMNDPAARPEISGKVADMDRYDVVLLGFPIWWYREPSIIDTFLESYDFTGKKIILFATSGGSGFGKTVQGMKKIVPSADIEEGRMMNGSWKESELKSWMDELFLDKNLNW